jgi:hypothetical protein
MKLEIQYLDPSPPTYAHILANSLLLASMFYPGAILSFDAEPPDLVANITLTS